MDLNHELNEYLPHLTILLLSRDLTIIRQLDYEKNKNVTLINISNTNK